jgi:hypothetical protein
MNNLSVYLASKLAEAVMHVIYILEVIGRIPTALTEVLIVLSSRRKFCENTLK